MINPYTGKEETRTKIVLELKANEYWDSDLGIQYPKLPDASLPVSFSGKKLRVTVEVAE